MPVPDLVIEKQGISGLTTDENGKTDVVVTVSIGISDFINQVEECLKQAAGGSGVAICQCKIHLRFFF